MKIIYLHPYYSPAVSMSRLITSATILLWSCTVLLLDYESAGWMVKYYSLFGGVKWYAAFYAVVSTLTLILFFLLSAPMKFTTFLVGLEIYFWFFHVVVAFVGYDNLAHQELASSATFLVLSVISLSPVKRAHGSGISGFKRS